LGEVVEIPTFDTADVFVSRLVRADRLIRDAAIEQALLRQPVALTDRSIQRRFVTATGLTYGGIRQIARANRAADLLGAGTPILDVVDSEGFSDQAHLTRSLKRFLGKTPGAIAHSRD
jgi:AraC-like DNA-binding protein